MVTVLSVLRAELLNQVLQGRKLSPVNQVELLGEEKMKKYTYKHTQLLSCSIRLVVIRRRSSKQPSALSKENFNSSCSRQPVMQTDDTKTQLERQLSAMLSSIWRASLLVSALDSSEVTTHADMSHHLREIAHFHLIHFLAQCLRHGEMQVSVRLYHTRWCKI